MILRVILSVFACGALFVTSTFVGMWWSFPVEPMRQRIEYEVAERSNDDFAISLGSLSMFRFSGIVAEDVTLYTVKKGRRSKNVKKPPLERSAMLELDQFTLSAALIPRLFGRQVYSFGARLNDGRVDGTWASSEGALDLDFQVRDLDLGKVPVADGPNALRMRGTLVADADLTLDSKDTKKSKGTLRFEFPNFALLGGSKVGGFDLPEVSFTKAVLAFEASDGKMEVTEGAFEGPVLNATVTGDITLNKRLGRSRLRLEVVFTLPEDLDQLAQIAPDMKRARDAEGKYHFTISGTLLSPTPRASRAGSRAGGLAADADDPPPLAGAGPRSVVNRDEDLSEEDRRARREDRIRERRERLRKRREEAERNNPMNRPDDGPMDDGPMDDGPMDEGPRRFDDGPRRFDDGPPPFDEGPPPFEGPPDEGFEPGE